MRMNVLMKFLRPLLHKLRRPNYFVFLESQRKLFSFYNRKREIWNFCSWNPTLTAANYPRSEDLWMFPKSSFILQFSVIFHFTFSLNSLSIFFRFIFTKCLRQNLWKIREFWKTLWKVQLFFVHQIIFYRKTRKILMKIWAKLKNTRKTLEKFLIFRENLWKNRLRNF